MPTKYIFVTGGVVSGLGKGITSASIGVILKAAGFTVDVIKMDPYLNIDPGTMSPYEHGEVYVLDDGSETDLDLGHYERFLDTNLSKISSATSGKIYSHILDQEREGLFLGKNVQLIPNVTNYIQEVFQKKAEEVDIRLIEIGGSTGDMEGEIFLESFRQFKQKKKGDVLHVHLGYVPFLKCSGEYKTKPIQTSVRELLKNGLQPDILAARYAIEDGEDIDETIMQKLALFSNLPVESVIKLPDMESIYSIPKYLYESNLEANLEKFLKTDLEVKLPEFFQNYSPKKDYEKEISIAVVAKYIKLNDSYLSVLESLKIAGESINVKVNPIFVDSEELEKDLEKSGHSWQTLKQAEGILVPGGFGKRGMEGKILAAQYAREKKVPYLGICLGLQMAVVEFARNVCNLNAVSSEMYEERAEMENKDILIDFMPEQLEIHRKGGTMRLGGYDCMLMENSIAKELYGQSEIRERHRHRLEVQGSYIPKLEEKGLVFSGKHFYKSNEGKEEFLVELVELPKEIHPYYLSTQSHPEFLSRTGKPHPLFKGLVEASSKRS